MPKWSTAMHIANGCKRLARSILYEGHPKGGSIWFPREPLSDIWYDPSYLRYIRTSCNASAPNEVQSDITSSYIFDFLSEGDSPLVVRGNHECGIADRRRFNIDNVAINAIQEVRLKMWCAEMVGLILVVEKGTGRFLLADSDKVIEVAPGDLQAVLDERVFHPAKKEEGNEVWND